MTDKNRDAANGGGEEVVISDLVGGFGERKSTLGTSDIFARYADDFAWCEEVIKQHSKSFYAAFSLLPEQKRQSVYALYAFCRRADDCVDIEQSRTQLLKLRRDFTRFLAGDIPDAPMWRALNAVFTCYHMEPSAFYDMLDGQEMDLDFSQPQTLGELEEYSYYVAGSVGLMLLPVLCTKRKITNDLRKSAIALGVAMQITNILRDVGEDLSNGRVYLPREVLEAHEYTLADLKQHRVSSSFIGLWEELAHRAESLYPFMERDIKMLDSDSRLPTLSALYLYRGILDRVRGDGYSCFTLRSHITNEQKKELVAHAEALLA